MNSYKNKIHEQEMLVGRKNAELLALHSQINPHFLFNVLESIRMHSILKKENETADMVAKLAVMQRQYVEWGNDSVSIFQEIEFVKAYLALQKYRFGERLNYDIEVDRECENFKIPKLTIVTFVENACVHGIESKSSPGWIFVRIGRQGERLEIEIEDTGSGMAEAKLTELQNNMCNADIEMLKGGGRVGIINACVRLKMVTENRVEFRVEVDKTGLKDGKLLDNDIVLFRYADVLLMQSEAKVRNGEDGDAELNLVRSRVGMAPRTATLENLLDERMMELAWEGWRRQDMIRFGVFTRSYSCRPQLPGEENGYTTVFPIPEKVIDMNPQLHQHKGY